MCTKKIGQKSHTGFYIFFSVLLLLIFIRYAFQIDIPRLMFLIIIVLIVLQGDKNEIIAMCMCCIPLHEAVDFFYSVTACAVILVFKSYKRFKVNITIFPLICLIVWELIHCFNTKFSATGLLSIFIPIIMLTILMCIDVSNCDYAFITRMIATTTLITCMMLLGKVLYFSGFNVLAAFASLQRLGLESETTRNTLKISGAVNPNTLGIVCVLVSTGLLQIRSQGQAKKRDMIMLLLLIVFGTLTSSRTYLVCLAVMVMLLLIGQKGTINKKIRFFLMFVIILAFGILILNILFPELMQYYSARFKVKDITTGRAELMIEYHKFIVANAKNLFFGIGGQDFANRLINVYRVTWNIPHNGIQELVVAWGVIGLIIFTILVVLMILNSKKYNKDQILLNYIPLIIILVKIQAGQMIMSSYTMLAFSYAYLSLLQKYVINETE